MTCLIGGLTNEQARQAVITYFQTNYSLGYEVIWPGQKPPSIEDRTTPFILLSFVDISREQEYIGSSEFVIDKALIIELWQPEFSGSKNIAVFQDFVDSLAVKIENGVVYRTPKYSSNMFKGWELSSAILPFGF
jgi:hypothetical protein